VLPVPDRWPDVTTVIGVPRVKVDSLGSEYRTQTWANDDMPEPSRVELPRQSQHASSKPSDGFFTATWDNTIDGSCWTDFLRRQGRRQSKPAHLWGLTPRPEGELFVIDSLSAYRELAEATGGGLNVDWNDVRADFTLAGIYVTQGAIDEESPEIVNPLWHWQFESTLWLRWCFLDEWSDLWMS
jgi:hypothetical protein